MRRNRRVYRLSSLLSRNSAIDRLADAITHDREVNSRSKRRVKQKHNPLQPDQDENKLNPIIAFGGGQFKSGGHGLQSVPRKAIVRKLSHRTVVGITPEHNTTKKCCICNANLVAPDLRAFDTDGNFIGTPKSFNKKSKTRLRRCQSEACNVQSNVGVSNCLSTFHKHWNRDVNAAINITNVAVNWLLYSKIPSAFDSSDKSMKVETPSQQKCITGVDVIELVS